MYNLEVVAVIGFDTLIDGFDGIRSCDFSSGKDFTERDTEVLLPGRPVPQLGPQHSLATVKEAFIYKHSNDERRWFVACRKLM